MIKDLSLTGEADSKIMGGMHGGSSGILSWFFSGQGDASA